MQNSAKLISSRIVLEHNKSLDDYEDLICAICQEVSLDIQECEECEHVYCQSCITDWKQKKDKCPYNCYPWKLKKPHKMVRNSLSSLKFKCKYSEQGCQQLVSLQNVEQHEQIECQFVEEKCQNKGCDKSFQKKDKKDHINECQFQLVPCKECDQLIQKGKIENHNCIKELIQKIKNLEIKIQQMYTQKQVQEIIDNHYVKKDEFENFKVQTQKKLEQFNYLAQNVQGNNIINDNKNNNNIEEIDIIEIPDQPNLNVKEPNKVQNQLQQQQKQTRVQAVNKGLNNLCPEGHILEELDQSFKNYNILMCNNCQELISKKKVTAHRCHACDFDRCHDCWLKPNGGNKKVDYCERGHFLRIQEIGSYEWAQTQCDICDRDLKVMNVISHQCAYCDFDRCHNCYLKGR